MNLALSTLLIILLLLPAFSFRIGISIPVRHRQSKPADTENLQSQLTGRNISKALSKLNFTETIFLFSIVPVILHLISILLISATGHSIKFDLLLNIFSGKENVLKTSGTNNSQFQHDLLNFLMYSLCQAVAGCLLGLFASWCFLRGQWILRTLLGNNIWYKIFTGVSLSGEKRKKIALILVEVLTVTKETTVIYSGWLKNYEVVANSEELSYLTLSAAARRDLRAGSVTTNRSATPSESVNFYDAAYGPVIQIPGHNLTIVGKEIINVNVTYMEIVNDPADPNKQIPVPIN